MFWLTPGCLFPSLCALVNNYLADGIMSDNESIHLIPHPVNQKSGHEVPPRIRTHLSTCTHTYTYVPTTPSPPLANKPVVVLQGTLFLPFGPPFSLRVCVGAAQDVCCQQT